MAKTTKSNTLLSFIIRVGLSALLLAWLFNKIDLKNMLDAVRTADVLYLFYAGLAFLICNFIILWRWFIFIRALGLSVTVGKVIRYYFMGLFGNLFLPSAIGGDIIKILGLCKDSAQKPRVVASVILDRLSGFASIVIIAVLALIFGYKLIGDNTLIIPIVIMAGASLMFAAVLFNERIYAFGCRIFNSFPKFKNSLMEMHYDVMLLADKRAEGYKAIAASCLSQLIFAGCYYLTAKALHQDTALYYFILFVPLICVASAVPSIGGLGVREVGAAYLFAKAGMDPGIGASLGLINFMFMVIVGLIGGAVYVFTFSSGRVQHNPSNAGLRAEQP